MAIIDKQEREMRVKKKKKEAAVNWTCRHTNPNK